MPRIRSIVLPALAAVLVAAVALLAKSGATTARPESRAAAATVHSGSLSVSVTNYAFSPADFTVKVGTRITFTNHDATAHTATANGGAFDTGNIDPNASRTIRVTRAGTFPYHCVYHAFMTGTITVVK